MTDADLGCRVCVIEDLEFVKALTDLFLFDIISDCHFQKCAIYDKDLVLYIFEIWYISKMESNKKSGLKGDGHQRGGHAQRPTTNLPLHKNKPSNSKQGKYKFIILKKEVSKTVHKPNNNSEVMALLHMVVYFS